MRYTITDEFGKIFVREYYKDVANHEYALKKFCEDEYFKTIREDSEYKFKVRDSFGKEMFLGACKEIKQIISVWRI